MTELVLDNNLSPKEQEYFYGVKTFARFLPAVIIILVGSPLQFFSVSIAWTNKKRKPF